MVHKKVFQKSKAWKKLEFKETISYGTKQLTCFCYGFCDLGMEEWNNSKRACHLIGTARGHVSKSQKCNLLSFSYWNMRWFSKDLMIESNILKTTFSTNKSYFDCHVTYQPSRDTVDQSWFFFYEYDGTHAQILQFFPIC